MSQQTAESKVSNPTPFSTMVKPIGPRCNIDCEYCYYLEKEKFYPDEKKFKMQPAVLERYIKDTISAQVEAGQKEVQFAWQGGEPTLLGVSYFEEIVALQRKYHMDGVKISNAFQTNGILLDDHWGSFLSDNEFLVGISIDGPRKVHDRYRVDRTGRPTFDKVMKGLSVLQNHQVEHNALTVIHRDNATKGKQIYKFLKSVGIEYIQFIPIVERSDVAGSLGSAPQIDTGEDLAITNWSVRPRAYGKFLCDVFDTWHKHDIGNVFVQFFDMQLALWMGLPSSLCVFAENCGNSLAVEHNGDLYSCDHYVYPEYRLGNIMEVPLAEMARSQRQMEFGKEKSALLTAQCLACEFRFACNGGCPKHRILTSKSGEPGHNYFCESYMKFFHHAGPRLKEMAVMVQTGRPAAAVHERRRKR